MLGGGRLYFVYLPQSDRYFKEHVDHNSFKKRVEVLDLVKDLDIPIVDIHEGLFDGHSDPMSLFPLRFLGGHYTAEGYNLVARIIAEKLFQNGKEQ